MKIRWRLTWYGIGFTALSLAGFIIVIILLVAGSSGEDQDKLLAGIADGSADVIESLDAPLELSSSPLVVDANVSDQPFTTVYDDSGAVLHSTGVVDGLPLHLPAAVVVEALSSGQSQADVDGVRVQVRRWENSTLGVGVVAVGQSLRVAKQQVAGLTAFLVIFGVVALVAAGIGAWFMSGRALRPLRLLAETTDEIGATGNLSQRLPPVRQNDEVGALSESFNTMLEGIETARHDRELTIDAQKRFVADASHELRSPLTSIRANAGFLAGNPHASAQDRAEATKDISDEADRMTLLIDSLLALARGDAETDGSEAYIPVDLSGVVRSVQRRARNLAVEVAVQTPDTCIVMGDHAQLAEFVWILVDNADKHGGDTVSITVVERQGEVKIVVEDDGPGIPTEDLTRVFDRFHRSDPTRSGPGYGLGLSIAQSIAFAHGGSIDVSNGEGGGAVFVVQLPSAH